MTDSSISQRHTGGHLQAAESKAPCMGPNSGGLPARTGERWRSDAAKDVFEFRTLLSRWQALANKEVVGADGLEPPTLSV